MRHIQFTKEASRQLIEKLRELKEVKYENKSIGTVEKVNEDGTIEMRITDPDVIALILNLSD